MSKKMKLFCEQNQNPDTLIKCKYIMDEACPETCAYAKSILERITDPLGFYSWEDNFGR